jgi:hypothetical protein
MCIICNTPGNEQKADEFLTEFAAAQRHMRAAAHWMLEISKVAVPAHRERYDGIHKDMVRQIREWNKLEEKREHSNPG